jgi:hypothetical protein
LSTWRAAPPPLGTASSFERIIWSSPDLDTYRISVHVRQPWRVRGVYVAGTKTPRTEWCRSLHEQGLHVPTGFYCASHTPGRCYCGAYSEIVTLIKLLLPATVMLGDLIVVAPHPPLYRAGREAASGREVWPFWECARPACTRDDKVDARRSPIMWHRKSREDGVLADLVATKSCRGCPRARGTDWWF